MKFCRTESPALKATESEGSSERIAEVDERIIDATERIQNHARERRGMPGKVQFTQEERAQTKKNIRRLADAAGN